MRGRHIFSGKKRKPHRTAPHLSNLTHEFTVTHPYHPLFSRRYEVLEYRRGWGRNYVAFFDDAGKEISIPVSWTDLEAESDAFVKLSSGRAFFRPCDLLELAELIEGCGR